MDSRPSPPLVDFSLGRRAFLSSRASLVALVSVLTSSGEKDCFKRGGTAFSPAPTPSSPCALNRIGQWTLVLSTRDDAQGGNTGPDGADESVSPGPFNVSEVPVQWNNRIHVAARVALSRVLFLGRSKHLGSKEDHGKMASTMASHPLLTCALSLPQTQTQNLALGTCLRAELAYLSLCPANGHATSGIVVARSMPTCS